MPETDPYIALQLHVARLIAADPWFDGIPVLTEEKGDILAEIDASLSRLGVSVSVMTPAAEAIDPDPFKPIAERVTVLVLVHEDPTLNQTGKAAMRAVTRVKRALHGKAGPNTGIAVRGHVPWESDTVAFAITAETEVFI